MGVLSAAAALGASFMRRVMTRGTIQTDIVATFGSSSIASYTSDHPDITITRTAAGTYNLTYPPAVSTTIAQEELASASLAVVSMITTAKAPTSGTATIKLVNSSGAATDPGSGETLTIRLTLGTEV